MKAATTTAAAHPYHRHCRTGEGLSLVVPGAPPCTKGVMVIGISELMPSHTAMTLPVMHVSGVEPDHSTTGPHRASAAVSEHVVCHCFRFSALCLR